MRPNRITATCEQCKQPFSVHPYKIRDGRGKFCSRECYWSNLRQRPTVTNKIAVSCAECGKSFETWPHRVRDGVSYCSRACHYAANRTGKRPVCETCGATFYANPQRISKGHGRYCSLPCRDVAKRKEQHTERNGWRYHQWRDTVYQRDSYTCQHCGQLGGKLNAHHIKPWNAFAALRYDVSNGITLCIPCHRKQHGIAA